MSSARFAICSGVSSTTPAGGECLDGACVECTADDDCTNEVCDVVTNSCVECLEADGLYREYYPNGQQFVDGQFKNGRQDGTWIYYYEDGKENRKVNYKNCQADGRWEMPRADGPLAAKRRFTGSEAWYNKGLQFQASYTFGRAKDDDSNERNFSATFLYSSSVVQAWYSLHSAAFLAAAFREIT